MFDSSKFNYNYTPSKCTDDTPEQAKLRSNFVTLYAGVMQKPEGHMREERISTIEKGFAVPSGWFMKMCRQELEIMHDQEDWVPPQVAKVIAETRAAKKKTAQAA